MAYSPFSPQARASGTNPVPFSPFAPKTPTQAPSFSPFASKTPASISGLGFSKSGSADLNDASFLLALAEARGGSVEDVANEILNPDRSLMSRIGSGFASAFSDFVKVISVPSNFMASVASKVTANPDDDMTVGEAIKKGAMPSDVLFGEMQSDASGMHKVGSFVTRFATDVLLDPLTYVTFGVGGGLLGVRAASEVVLGTGLAKRAAFEGGKLVTREVEETIVRTLSKRGQDLFLKAVELQKNGLTATARKEFFVRAGVQEGSEAAAALLKDGSKELDLLVSKTLEEKLDRQFVLDTLGKMIGTGTYDNAGNLIHSTDYLAKTFLDQGGIKFFGKTIVSGQRIINSLEMIPGYTTLDLVTQPARNALKSVFNPAVDAQFGALPKEYVSMRQTAKDLFESGKIKDVTLWTDVVKAFKLNADETNLLGAAIEAGKIPSDTRLQNAFIAVKGLTGKRELNKLRNAGVYVTESSNYIPHMLVDTETRTVGRFSSSASANSNAAKEAKIAKFIDVTTGKEMVGTPERLGLSKFVTQRKVRKVQEKLAEFVKNKEGAMASLTDEMKTLMLGVDEAFQGRATAQFKALIDALPIEDQENLQALTRAFKTRLPSLDVEKMVTDRAAATLKEGVRVAPDATEGLSEAGVAALEKRVEKLKARMAKGESQLAGDIESINKALKDYKPTEKVSKKGLSAEGEADEVVQNLKATAAAVKDESRFARDMAIDKGLDEKAMAQFVASLADEFVKNPVGARRLMDSIIGKQQKLRDLVEDIAFERLSAKQALDELPDSAFVYRDAEGGVFERSRASLEEIKAAGFEGFEENVVLAGVARSIENTKAAVMNSFLKDVAKSAGRPLSEAPSGWRTVEVKALKKGNTDFSDFIRAANGEELAFHPAVAKDLENFASSVINDETTQQVMRAYDKLQNLFKASVTSIFPAFHGRNAISNVFLHFMDIGVESLNPVNHATAAWLVTEDRILNREARKLVQLDGMIDRKIGQAKPALEQASKPKPVPQDFSPALSAISDMGSLRLSKMKVELEQEFGDELKDEIRNMFKNLENNIDESDLVDMETGAFKMGTKQSNRGSKLVAKYGTQELRRDSDLFQQMLNFGEKVDADGNLLRKSGRTGGVASETIAKLSKKFTREGIPPEKWIDQLVNSGQWRKMSDLPLPLDKTDNKFWEGVFKKFQGTDRSKSSFLKALTGETAPAAQGLQARKILREYNIDDLDAFYHRMDELIPDAPKVTEEVKVAREQVKQAAEIEADALRAQIAVRLAKTVFTDRSGYQWSLGELRNLVKDTEVAFSPFISGAIDVRTPAKEMAAELFPHSKSALMRVVRKGNFFSEHFAPWRGGREVGRAIEEQARLVDFIANLKNTGDPMLAAGRTKQFLFDYNNLTDFEKTFLRRIIPFYTFTRKNIEGQVRALLTTPGRISAEIHALHSIGEAMGAKQLSEEDRKKLPAWLNRGLNLVTKRQGDNIEILNNIGTPIEAAFNSVTPSGLLGSISPLLKVPTELMTGYNFFQLKPLKDSDRAMVFRFAPQGLKDWIGYQETQYTLPSGEVVENAVALHPKRLYFVMNLPPTSRMIQTLSTLTDPRTVGTPSVLEETTGFKYFDFNLTDEELKRDKETVKKMQELLVKAKVVSSYNNVYIPKDQKNGVPLSGL